MTDILDLMLVKRALKRNIMTAKISKYFHKKHKILKLKRKNINCSLVFLS